MPSTPSTTLPQRSAADVHPQVAEGRARARTLRTEGRWRDAILALNQVRERAAGTSLATPIDEDIAQLAREWASDVEAKDLFTAGHIERVATLALALAEAVGVPAAEREGLQLAALLHDVGKVVVSPEILNKPGRLTPDEWAVMRLHAGAGADMLRELEFAPAVRAAVRAHHENFDGSGYPDGLRGEAIPLWSRIVTVADVYDVLTSERSYKRALTHDEAIAVMRRETPRQFDPQVTTLLDGAARSVMATPRPAPVAAAPVPIAAQAHSVDDLTGLPLRRTFLDATRVALASASDAAPLSLAVIDVDHFKLVNDTFGHLQGDDCLRMVAATLKDQCGAGDLPGRYAGDEFVVLLPGRGHEEALAAARTLCEAVASHRLVIRDRREGTLGVTLSIGVVTTTGAVPDVESLFAAADRALYLAKRRGRNQAASATEAEEAATTATLQFERFVGRERELRTLIAQLEAAFAGQPKLVAIEGEAGIGKTSLVRQLLPEVRLRGGAMVSGRCLATDVKPPYGVWIEVLEALQAMHLAPPGRWRELPRLLPALGDGTPLPANPGSKYALLAELAEFLRQAARLTPLTIVLDDIQWADTSSGDALEYLRHELSDDRLLICMTVRAEDAGPFVERRRHLSRDERFRDFVLQRFSEADLRAWLEAILHQGDISADFVRFIHRYTEGNPLLVVHVLRSLEEDGAIWYAGRRWQWKDQPELQLPTAVADLIDSRIERLSDEARAHLTVAAVVGRAFEFDVVRAAGSMDEEELLDAVDEGIAAHVIESTGDRDGDRFAFSHVLIADAIRKRVQPRRLARMHGQVAAALEQLRPNAVASIAAHHDAAGNSAGAYSWARKAAELAVAVYAHQEAAMSWQLAERHAPDAVAARDCQVRRLQALEMSGAYEEASTLCDLILADEDPATPLLSIRRARERLRSLLGQPLEQTARALAALLDEATTHGDGPEEVEVLGMQSRVMLRLGDPLAAHELGRRSVTVAERQAHPALLATTLMYLGSALVESDAGEARLCYERALTSFEAAGDEPGQARAWINLGIARSRAGEHQAAASAYATAVSLGRKIHSPDLTGLAALNLGVLHLKLGEFADADRCLAEAMERFALLKNEPHRLAALYNQANLAREQADHARASALYGDAAVVAAGMNQLDVEVGARAGQGLAWLAMGRDADARACLHSCEVRIQGREAFWFQGRELFDALTIRLLVSRGDVAKATAHFARAVALATTSDAYGAAWLVADVTGPLAQAGEQAGWAHVEHFGEWAAASDYAPLRARYAALRGVASPVG